MQIRLEAVPWLARAMGHEGPGKMSRDYVCPSGHTVGSLLFQLVEEHPDLQSYVIDGDGTASCPHVMIVLNGKLLNLPQDIDHPLREGDIVVLLPPFAGG